MAKKIEKWPPKLDLAKAFEVMEQIYKNYGKSVNIDLLPDILDTSRKSSNFTKRVYALQLFGLASLTNDILVISSLGMRLVAPVNLQEKKDARIECFGKISVLRELSDRFPNANFPEQTHLRNLLMREYNLDEESVDDWLEFIIKSVDAVKPTIKELIEGGSKSPEQITDVILSDNVRKEDSPTQRESVEVRITSDMMKIPLAGERYLMIPKDLTNEEASYFQKWFELWKTLPK